MGGYKAIERIREVMGVHMGPLWAWVLLWLVSAYGLVFLLRIALARMAVEPVPVLVATPRPAEPAPAIADPGLEESATGAPAPETPAPESAATTDDRLAAPSPAQPDEPGELPPPVEAETSDQGPDAPWIKEREATEAGETWIKERESAEAGEPWIKEREAVEPSEPWIREKEETTFDEPWVKEKEDPELTLPPVEEPEELSVTHRSPVEVEADDDDEDVVYRAIDLGSLTLGLEASEIQGLYGLPGHVSKLGEDGERWRYPLNATDDHGDALDCVLVLEFQRGRLVRKAMEAAADEEAKQ